MLPKIDVPIYETTLISTGKTIKFRPFLVKEQKLFMMAAQSDNSKDVIDAIRQVLTNCILDTEVDVNTLPSFDLEYLFMHLRARSVGEVVNLRYVCNNKVKDEKGEDENKKGRLERPASGDRENKKQRKHWGGQGCHAQELDGT